MLLQKVKASKKKRDMKLTKHGPFLVKSLTVLRRPSHKGPC